MAGRRGRRDCVRGAPCAPQGNSARQYTTVCARRVEQNERPPPRAWDANGGRAFVSLANACGLGTCEHVHEARRPLIRALQSFAQLLAYLLLGFVVARAALLPTLAATFFVFIVLKVVAL